MKIIELLITPFICLLELFTKEKKDEQIHKEILRNNGSKYDLPRIHKN
jgi:hypothetical protein